MSDDSAKNLFTIADIANRIGVGVKSARVYHSRAVSNRRNGELKAGDLPAPDLTIGRSPVWYPSTIEAWENSRPGRGKRI
jgi:hypothetical protein